MHRGISFTDRNGQRKISRKLPSRIHAQIIRSPMWANRYTQPYAMHNPTVLSLLVLIFQSATWTTSYTINNTYSLDRSLFSLDFLRAGKSVCAVDAHSWPHKVHREPERRKRFHSKLHIKIRVRHLCIYKNNTTSITGLCNCGHPWDR